MLATPSTSSSKMMGLDLATRPEREPKRSITDELLSTPKTHESGVTILSPRFHTYSSSSMSSSGSSKSGHPFTSNGLSGGGSNKGGGGDDMLMTPVLTTPGTADVWCGKKASDSADYLPENLSSNSDVNVSPCDPPKDLPMDSDIGLRSPCAGLLAKRRKLREMSKRTESFNSDSNSCDTPTSENSPHDLTTRKNLSALAELDNSRRAHYHLSPRTKTGEQLQLSPSIRVRSFGSCEATTTAVPSLHLPPEERPYTDFKKPNTIQSSTDTTELPAHYTPSPLAVPSPNWSVIDNYFGKEMIRTPKNLDTPSVFNFLGFAPSTPRSAKWFRDLSPNRILEYYPGRDQHLSPRLPIPDTPTDLSSRSVPPLIVVNESNEAEDLSTKSKNIQTHPPSPPPTPPLPRLNNTPFQPAPLPVKIEYEGSPPPQSVTPPNSGPNLIPLLTVKSESATGHSGAHPRMDNYDSGSQVSNLAQMTSRSFPNSFYLTPGIHASYHSQQVFAPAELERLSPPRTLSPPQRLVYDRQIYQPPWTGLGAQNITSGGGLVDSQHTWTTPVKEEPTETTSPTAHSMTKSQLFQDIPTKHRKKNLKRSSDEGSRSEDDKRNKKKGKAGKDADTGLAADGSKRVYVCPHCQRSYDWNYNLNRHLKYECGKENAFQCSKCGRKFPHKQNCVYHLKRKHKVVCDSIDQYMTEGLVIFKGSSHPTGLTEARVKSEVRSNAYTTDHLHNDRKK